MSTVLGPRLPELHPAAFSVVRAPVGDAAGLWTSFSGWRQENPVPERLLNGVKHEKGYLR